jgi:predicted TIM-barrel fold metal-dependent hydrolase
MEQQRRLITADSHSAAPLTLANELPERLRSKVPHLEERGDGVYLVRPFPAIPDEDGNVAQGDMMTKQLAAGIKVDPDDDPAMARVVLGDVTAEANPSFSVEARLAEMARDGVVGEVLMGVGGSGLLSDPDVGLPWAQIVNDWSADTYRDHLDQFAPGIDLPLYDAAVAAKELERAVGMGLRPGFLPDVVPNRPYSSAFWEPLWEAAAGLRVPLVFHLSGGRAAKSDRPRSSMAMTTAMTTTDARKELTFGSSDMVTGLATISAGVVETVGWLVMSGVLERHPDLQVVMTESTAGWLGWLMDFMDFYHQQRWSGPDGGMRLAGFIDRRPKIAELPSHYVRRQVKCTFMHDAAAIRQRDFTGLDCLMWGNDYPHIEGTFPYSQKAVDEQFAGVPEDEIIQIVHDNAAGLYRLDQRPA